jgi:hypothetical protein
MTRYAESIPMRCWSNWLWLSLFAALSVLPSTAGAADASAVPSVVELAEQNRRLQQQIERQQHMIDELAARLSELQKAGEQTRDQVKSLDENSAAAADTSPSIAVRDREHEIHISGEAGFAFFSTGSAGQFPDSDFRIDDAKLFLETSVMRDIYFLSELQLFPRESGNANLQLGELYVDFENVSGHVGWAERLVNVRAGRINTPFGEEYLVRGPMANPLISHSLADIWGLDTGVEIYGSSGSVRYAVAVQNGGANLSRDYSADKSVAVRLGWDPLPWLHLSGSGMRTGNLKVETPKTPGDGTSALWFGNAFFRQLGPTATTTTFHANLWEIDATARWSNGHVSAALGTVSFDDNDTTADNSRRLTYGHVEVVQSLTDDLYGAARYSRIDAPGGYPLVGWGDYGNYFYVAPLTEELSRLSLGIGYRIGPPIVLKFEYAFEWGRLINGDSRNHENFLGSELGITF